MKYNSNKIEKKWQKKWEGADLYKAKDFSKKPKKYIMVEFPYPSGEGLHVGHVRSYSALDALARKKRMEGYNVLYPMGWDAFGLPAENYAIKTGIHPKKTVSKNVKTFKKQIKALGLSVDWSREINTTDPEYYKWSQWIFLQFFKKGLAYQAEMPINWCPSCKIGLAKEEVVGGNCERCGAEATTKRLKQWMLKITEYADRLIDDLEKVDYVEKIKTQQVNWIGRSYGFKVRFQVEESKNSDPHLISPLSRGREEEAYSSLAKGKEEEASSPLSRGREEEASDELFSPLARGRDRGGIEVFTTRLDTIFGVTGMAIAPEHPLLDELTEDKQKKEVNKYVEKARQKSEFERTELEKEKTGVFTGGYVVNPLNGEKVPVWVSDFVVGTYGGGAVMIVPAHDKRDYAFAEKYGLKIREVISGGDASDGAYVDYGELVNSGEYSGLSSEEAIKKIGKWLKQKKLGEEKVNYKLRDWIFSRQHYWGEPIPIIHCKNCGAVPVDEKDLPIKLPNVEKYQPTETGESPLAKINRWVNVKCPKCGGSAKRETDTMPNWAGSSWYFLRYVDPRNSKKFADFKKLKYWLPVDLYNGGMEHTTLHLLYSRFWHKFLYDLKLVPTTEPYQRRTSHGVVLAEDGYKMSKSKGNVINPDSILKKYGADTLRVYEMFMGPFDQAISWSSESMQGCFRFLNRIWQIFETKNKVSFKTSKELTPKLHQLIKKVSEDLDNMKFNTAVAALMSFSNAWFEEGGSLSKKDAGIFLKLISPFTPHLAEELWEKTGGQKSVFSQNWPEYDKKLIQEKTFNLIVQINGKMRDKIEVSQDISEQEAKKLAMSREKIEKWLIDKEPKKIIYVPKKLVNIVI